MNSATNTAAFTFSAASVQQFLDGVASLYHVTLPTDVSVFLAAAFVAVGHAVYNYYVTKNAKVTA
jgi:hypothetical protein